MSIVKDGFYKQISGAIGNNNYLLLAGGGHLALSELAVSDHDHDTRYTKKIQAIPFVIGNTSGTAGTWTGTCDDIDAYYDGLSIIYINGVAGASTTTLNINGLGAATCYYTATTNLAATHPASAFNTTTILSIVE